MARKSNKTAHVLNLITNTPAKNDIADADLTAASQGEADSVSVPIMPEVPPKPKVTIPILEMATGEKDPVSNIIKNKLLEEAGELTSVFEKDLNLSETGLADDAELNIDDDLHAHNSQPPESGILSDMNIEGTDTAVLNSYTGSTDHPAKQTQVETSSDIDVSMDDESYETVTATLSDPDKISATDSSPSAESSAAENPEPLKAEPDYRYINVMEEIVRECVVEYMNKFEMCTCNRCIIDTTALALTNLSPKYIVADKDTISPLLNYYTNKFSPYVIMELTKSCLTVSEKPHH